MFFPVSLINHMQSNTLVILEFGYLKYQTFR